MIEVAGLSKSFRIAKKKRGNHGNRAELDPREQGREFHTLRDISFTAREGEIIGLLGLNGAGKTTLLRVLSTALKPSAGTATVNGFDVASDPLAVRKKIGFLSGNTGLYGRLSPHEIVTFYGRMHGIAQHDLEPKVLALFDRLEISSFAHQLCDTLSTGMKQKVSIARSIIHDPEVIIFDEPTTGLDVAAAQNILGFIEQCKNEGKSIIFSTHHMHEVEKLCDWVVIIHQGEKCFEGTVDEMRAKTGKSHLDEAYLELIGRALPAVNAGVGSDDAALESNYVN